VRSASKHSFNICKQKLDTDEDGEGTAKVIRHEHRRGLWSTVVEESCVFDGKSERAIAE
jgi:hypothetical protein